jgi:hypothetical protein
MKFEVQMTNKNAEKWNDGTLEDWVRNFRFQILDFSPAKGGIEIFNLRFEIHYSILPVFHY